MRKFISFFTLLYILTNASAQNDSIASKRNYEFGGRSGFYFTGSYVSDFNYYGYLTLRKGIHELSIGPSLERPFRLKGVDFTYRILPNGSGKVFDFYFQLNYFQKWDEKTISKTIFDYSTNAPYLTDQIKLNSSGSQLILEYGFDVKFLKHFYVGMGLGIGGQITFRNYDYVLYNELNYKTTSEELDFIFRTNIGFRF